MIFILLLSKANFSVVSVRIVDFLERFRLDSIRGGAFGSRLTVSILNFSAGFVFDGKIILRQITGYCLALENIT